ncbi:MAG: QueT transporter family protein [Erysipelotrichaceae bacterium]|nr:QueT transporter family protein [Erysipelotrichaceae bacterium]
MNANNMTKRIRQICLIALIAAIYATTTLILAPISFGNIQCRISEALTLLAILCPEAIIGVTIGCALSNAVSVAMGASIIGVLDIVFGTLATFLAGVVSYYARSIRWKNIPVISALAPILFNGVFIGAMLAYVIAPQNFWMMFLICGIEVAVGEAIACVVLGIPLALRLEKLNVMKKFGI